MPTSASSQLSGRLPRRRTKRVGWCAPLGLALLAACHTEGVLPPGLLARGSLGSVDYVAAELYPGQGEALALVRPRMGSPALLGPGEATLTVEVWLAQTEEASALEVTAQAEGQEAYHLAALTPVDCDALGLCRLAVGFPAEAPRDLLFALCVAGPSGSRCHPGAVRRYAELPDTLRVAHLTDLHLLMGSAGNAREARLRHLLERIAAHRPALHLVVVTGDLTDDGGPDAARQAADALGTSPLPVITVPGNHDFKDGGIVHYLLAMTPELDHAHRLGPYLVVALNSGPGRWEQERRGWNGESAGVEAAQITWLQALLAGGDGASLLLVHHPPWSALGMRIGRRRRALLHAAREGGVSAILAGHTHRREVFDGEGVGQGLSLGCEDDIPQRRHPITLVASPSLDRLEGGFGLVELDPAGGLAYCRVSVGWP